MSRNGKRFMSLCVCFCFSSGRGVHFLYVGYDMMFAYCCIGETNSGRNTHGLVKYVTFFHKT